MPRHFTQQVCFLSGEFPCRDNRALLDSENAFPRTLPLCP